MQTDHEIAQHFGLETAAVRRLIQDWCVKLPDSDVYDAIAKAIRYEARSWRYVERILRAQIPRQTELKPQRVGRPRFPESELERYLDKHRALGNLPPRPESRVCGYCGNPIPDSKRSNSLYCSNRCRLYGHRSRDNQ